MKMTKRFATLCLFVMILAVGVFVFASCGDCDHEWGEWTVTEQSTCHTQGSEMRVCKNDSTHTETRAIATTEHNFAEYVSDNNLTCTTDGTETAKCKNRGCTATDTRIVAAGNSHSFTKYVDVDATCTEDSYKIAHCDAERCYATDKKVNHGTALGHDFDETHVCVVCNEAQTVINSWKLESKDGSNIIVTLYKIADKNAALYIAGKGDMPDFEMNAAPWKSNASDITAVYVSDAITAIGDYNFYGLSNATSINIPENVTAIGANAFSGCYALPAITIPAKVATIGASAFANCSGATAIVFEGNLVEKIDEKAFYGCFSVEALNLPTALTTIGTSAFYNLKALKEITIPASVTEIATKAFDSCKALESITFADGSKLATIGDEAFKKCGSLLAIEFPEALASIGNAAFTGCSDLTEVKFTSDANVKFIGTEVFEDCDSIEYNEDDTAYYLGTDANPYAFLIKAKDDVTTAVVADSTVLIVGEAFADAKDITDITLPFIGISEYSNEYKFSYIFNKVPNSLKTVTVTKPAVLVDYAFEGCKKLESIVFAGGIFSIGTGAFDGCTALTLTDYNDARYLAIGSNLYAVLVEVDSAATEITVHKGTIAIDSAAFLGCKKLTKVDVEAGNTVYKAIGGGIVDVDNKALVVATAKTEIPADGSVTSIANGAFKNLTTVKSIEIPETVVSIGNFAFAGCTALKEVVIPNSVTSIGLGAFADCSKLTSITLPFIGATVDGDSNTAFGYIFATEAEDVNSQIPKTIKTVVLTGSTKIAAEAFMDCSKLENITIAETVEFIGASAFEKCNSLKAVYVNDLAKWCGITFENLNSNPTTFAHTIYVNGQVAKKLIVPNTVEKISYAAFSGLSTIVSISLPASVKTIEEEAFVGCSGLKSISIPALGKDADVRLGQFFGIDAETGKYALPESLTSITISGGTEVNAEMFKDCATVEVVSFAKTITFVGRAAFEGCTALNTVNANDIDTWASIYFEDVNANPLTYAHNLYINGILAENIVITDKAVIVNNAAFSGCTSIKTVVIENGVTAIGEFAFINCASITSISIADSVTDIDNYAFAGCYNLAEIKLPKALVAINEFVFSGCTNIQKISIDEAVAFVAPNAFIGCDALAEISVVKSNAAYASKDGILYNKEDATIAYIPLSLKGDITLLDGIKNVAAGLFVNYPYVYSITLPNSVVSIEANAFAGLTNLKSITLPFIGESVTAENEKAALGYIFGTIPTTLISVTVTGKADIKANAFAGCSTVTTVSILGETVAIGENAFLDCENLLTLALSKSVKSIGDNAFFGCRKLDTVYYYGEEAEWKEITIGENNASLTASRILFYSEKAPETVGTHWHFNEEGKRVIW